MCWTRGSTILLLTEDMNITQNKHLSDLAFIWVSSSVSMTDSAGHYFKNLERALLSFPDIKEKWKWFFKCELHS